MSRPFQSFGALEIRKSPTRDEMAAELATETCENYKALRAAAKSAEEACEPSHAWNDQAAEYWQTLEALMKGRHRWIAVPIILEHFPELLTKAQATQAEIDAATKGGEA